MDFLKKIQSLPEEKRRFILWSIVIVISLIFFIIWVKSSSQVLRFFPKEDFIETFNSPLREKLKDFPGFEMPKLEVVDLENFEITDEEWELLEQELTQEQIDELKTFLEEIEKQKEEQNNYEGEK